MNRRTLALLFILFAVSGLVAACNSTPIKRQAQADLTLGFFADTFAAAIESKKLTDPNLIRAGREILNEWNQADIELNAARMFGNADSVKFVEHRLYGDGTPENPGIIARAAALALHWKG